MNKIDPTAIISALSDIETSARGTSVEIGANSVIDAFVKIKTVGGDGDIVIGKNVYLNSGIVIYSGNGIKIGDNCLIAANCTFAATNHEFADPNKLIREQGFKPSRGGITLGNDVWVGANSVLLDGTEIGEGAVVAAGSVVRGKLEPYGVYAGSPASKVGHRNG